MARLKVHTYVMRDVISGEYLPLTIEHFCNILPGDGDEMVAPSQAINWENSPIRPVRSEKGADSRHRNEQPANRRAAREIDACNSVISRTTCRLLVFLLLHCCLILVLLLGCKTAILLTPNHLQATIVYCIYVYVNYSLLCHILCLVLC